MNSDYPLTTEQIATYQRDGFIHLPDILSSAELAAMREAVTSAVREDSVNDDPNRVKSSYEQIFIQKVNLWARHQNVRPHVLSKRFGNIAAKLMGTRARIWHDQALFKEPHTGAKTPWHQDTPYWPHEPKRLQTTIWIALRDATIQNGCMSFLPGTHQLLDIEPVNLANPQDLYDVAPQTRGLKPVTIELKAGSCTFHNGMTFHYAGPNRSDGMREAFAIIYMPDGTTYNGVGHVVTDQVKDTLKVGGALDTSLFPIVSD
ncbi:MAG: phytanoyl-CoA dioxygenase family protein [Opitutaceae bacterium]|nr:phytanoyl-CoA dioxygenase family protein [Opitutaceae bacterium]